MADSFSISATAQTAPEPSMTWKTHEPGGWPKSCDCWQMLLAAMLLPDELQWKGEGVWWCVRRVLKALRQLANVAT